MYQVLAILALFTLAYSSVAGRIERTWISGPMIFTLFGLLIGPVGFDLLPLDIDGEAIRTLAELTLALVLFTDAAGADMGVLKEARALPIRLLLIGLPLTILLGFGLGVLLIDKLSLFEIALGKVLQTLKSKLGSPGGAAKAAARALEVRAVPEAAQPYLERMGLAAAGSLMDKMVNKMIVA